MNITIREAKIEDCSELTKLKHMVWETTYRGVYPDTKIDRYDFDKNEQRFREIVLNKDIKLFVAVDDTEIIGYMGCGKPLRPFDNYEQEIALLYLLKSYQGLGLGKKLFKLGKQVIRNNGYNEFFVSCNSFNKPALDFYQKMGGEIVHIDDEYPDKSQMQTKFHYQIFI